LIGLSGAFQIIAVAFASAESFNKMTKAALDAPNAVLQIKARALPPFAAAASSSKPA
jgi:hypothetical protein